jgi:dTDP-4-dehydrorhamnose 3,5-epimerase
MLIRTTLLPGVLLLESVVHGDGRGFFLESFHRERFAALGLPTEFVQDNASRSVRDTLRGLHFQHPHAQGKLVRVVTGRVFDVAVDIRRGSPDFGRWYGCELSDTNNFQMWIPPGYAHGFCVLSDVADFSYKCTEYYHPESEQTLAWDDPDIGIAWPGGSEWILSEKDRAGKRLSDIDWLPVYGDRETVQ